MVLYFKDKLLKMQIGKGTTFLVPILHSKTCEVFLIHMGSAIEAIKKKGYLDGKTCKTPHIQKSYFVIPHKNLPILYCRTLFCILFSVLVFLSELCRSVLMKMPIFFAFFFFPVTYFVSYFVLTHKLIGVCYTAPI